MASPFSVFRRNRKASYAVLGVMCMFGFVILPNIMDRSSGRTNPVVVELGKYGELRESNLQQLLNLRRGYNGFVEGLVMQGVSSQIAKNEFFSNLDSRERLGYLNYLAEQELSQLSQQGIYPKEMSDEAIAYAYVLNQRAANIGLEISDRAANAFISRLGRNRVTELQIRQVIASTVFDNENQLFAAIKFEVGAHEYQNLLRSGGVTLPPAERWDYYQRLHRRAVVEAVAFPVADFAQAVATPDETALRKLFEDYKDDLEVPGSAEVGFRQPQRVALEFFRVEHETFYNQALDKVTAEEIRAEYENDKDLFYKVRPGAEFSGTPGPIVVNPFGADDTSPEGAADSPTDPSTDDASGGVDPPADGTSTESGAGDAAPQSDSPSPSSPPAAAPEDTTDGQQGNADWNGAGAGRVLASLPEVVIRGMTAGWIGSGGLFTVQDATSGAADAEAPSSKPAGEPTETSSPPATSTPTRAADSTETEPVGASDGDTTAQGGSEPQSAEDQPQDAGPTLADDYVLIREIEGGTDPAYRPLHEVSDEIRRRLANTKTSERTDKIVSELRAHIKSYENKWVKWQITQNQAGDDQSTQPPPNSQFEQLAADTEGVTFHRLALMSRAELTSDTEIGKAMVDGGPQGQGVIIRLFDQLTKLSTTSFSDVDANMYLVWKVDDADEHVPKFADVREKVEAVWRTLKARDHARAAAEELANDVELKKALADGKSLAEFFGDKRPVIETASFSWMQDSPEMNTSAIQPPLSEIEGIDQAGTEFMRVVFGLDGTKLGVAFNGPKSVAYLVHLVRTEPPEDELLRNFVQEPVSRYLLAGSDDIRAQLNGWQKYVLREAGADWKKKPQSYTRR